MQVLLIAAVVLIVPLVEGGVKRYQNRIIGGRDAEPGDAPYIGSLRLRNYPKTDGWGHICGLAVICPTAVLTAAHCTVSTTANNLRVIVGILRLDDKGQTLDVGEIVYHPKFNPQRVLVYDIAILRLKGSMQFNSDVMPVKLPKKDAKSPEKFDQYGWGSIDPRRQITPVNLKYAELPHISDDDCLKYMSYVRKDITGTNTPAPIKDYNICAGSLSAGAQATCHGDSGGPLVKNNITYGVISWSYDPCGRVNATGVYSKVAYFEEFIHNNVGDKCSPVFVSSSSK